MLRETRSLGRVLPRAPSTRTDSWEVSAPSRETEVSDVDRSAALGLFENKRLDAAPTLEERFIELVVLGVSSRLERKVGAFFIGRTLVGIAIVRKYG